MDTDTWQFLLVFFGAAVGSFGGGYLGEKGRLKAIQEDLRIGVVRATEEVKALVEGQAWVSQGRWTFRANTYSTLLAVLAEFRSLLLETHVQWTSEVARRITPQEKREAMAERISQLSLEVEKAGAVAQIWLAPSATEALNSMKASLAEALSTDAEEQWSKAAERVNSAITQVVAAAREDLSFRPEVASMTKANKSVLARSGRGE
jgi:hypothetical protein